MKTADPAALKLMQTMGGSFVSALAAAWMRADPVNQERLMTAFGDIYDRYEAQANAEPK